MVVDEIVTVAEIVVVIAVEIDEGIDQEIEDVPDPGHREEEIDLDLGETGVGVITKHWISRPNKFVNFVQVEFPQTIGKVLAA